MYIFDGCIIEKAATRLQERSKSAGRRSLPFSLSLSLFFIFSFLRFADDWPTD